MPCSSLRSIDSERFLLLVHIPDTFLGVVHPVEASLTAIIHVSLDTDTPTKDHSSDGVRAGGACAQVGCTENTSEGREHFYGASCTGATVADGRTSALAADERGHST